MATQYAQLNTSDRISIRDMFDILQKNYIARHADIDPRELSNYATNPRLISCKLCIPTLHTCAYFSRYQGKGEHTGIDIIMPQGTPIHSLTHGKVVRIKHRNGNPDNEGNCIVIQTPDNHYIAYEHLEHIHVSQGQHVSQGTPIGTCGTTGNSTQYHLHLQIDTAQAPFHPYRHQDAHITHSYTIDPLPYLSHISPTSIFKDMPTSTSIQQAIIVLKDNNILKGHNNMVYPDNTLKRYEMALLIDRILQKYDYYAQLDIKQSQYTSYIDTDIGEHEFTIALKRLQKYGIMKGSGNVFEPNYFLTGEQLLAILGRIFYNLQDDPSGSRRKNYQDTFVKQLIISQTRGYIKKHIPRKEVFLILYKTLKNAGLM